MFGLDWFFGLLTGVFHWLQQQLTAYGIDLTKLDVVSNLWQYMKVANDVVPLLGSFKILFDGFVVKASIRAVRWVLSCIPSGNQLCVVRRFYVLAWSGLLMRPLRAGDCCASAIVDSLVLWVAFRFFRVRRFFVIYATS